MVEEDFKRAFDTACAELERLTEQREATDRRIAQLKQTIVALSPLAKDKNWISALKEAAEEAGITDGCRDVLRTSEKPLTPIEVKDQLQRLGHDFSEYTNPLASIHAVLKRLLKSGQAQKMTTKDGDTAYRWIRRFPRFHRRRRFGGPPLATEPIVPPEGNQKK